jgi:hypothetical protein
VRLPADLPARARARSGLKPEPGEPPERYFQRRQVREAIAFAESGGIAIHRNFDHYHGTYIRGMKREKPFLHVIGRREVLASWGLRHGLRPEWMQPEKHRAVAHFDVFGPAADAMIKRFTGGRDTPG